MKLASHESGSGVASCYDVLHDVDAALRESMAVEGQRYFVLGGVASGALAHESTTIDRGSQTVVATNESAIPTLRPNGTRRDVDILIDTVLEDEEADRIKNNVIEAVEDKLLVSVFGLDRHIETPGRAGRLALAATKWLSSRTVDGVGTLRYELFPLERQVDPDSYAQWKLKLPSGQQVDVLHPAGHVLAYRMRSISGVRSKDQAKYDAMCERVLPEFPEEVHDGPFRAWVEFADDIETFRTQNEVSEGGSRSDATKFDGAAFRTKARFLHWLESQERIVDFAQGDAMQRALNVFVHAK